MASFAAGFLAGKRGAPEAVKTEVDTVFVYSTKGAQMPSFETVTLDHWEFFTETVTDTVETLVPYAVHDTIFVPITQKYYEQLDGRLRIWISGYNPRLDQWELDEETQIVTRNVKSRWNFSVGVGPGVIYTPFHKCPVDAGIGVFAGVTYSF